MQLARGLGHLPPLPHGCVATIGNFDGVHLGHQEVIENLAAQGRRLNLPVVVVVFEPQPREYFAPQQSPARLTRFREKLTQLALLPVDVVLLLHFDHTLAECPADVFIRQVLVESLRVRYLVVGDDFRFGKGRAGSFSSLQAAGVRYGFEVADTGSVQLGGARVSSSLIREALAVGDMTMATRLFGRPYSVIGRVRYGEQLGRTLGFPTANIALMRKKAPLQGVFAVTMTLNEDGPRPGVANVGCRPTVDGRGNAQLETHVFDFDENLYGRLVEVHFHHKLRDERRFENLAALQAQIALDAAAARNYFARLST